MQLNILAYIFLLKAVLERYVQKNSGNQAIAQE